MTTKDDIRQLIACHRKHVIHNYADTVKKAISQRLHRNNTERKIPLSVLFPKPKDFREEFQPIFIIKTVTDVDARMVYKPGTPEERVTEFPKNDAETVGHTYDLDTAVEWIENNACDIEDHAGNDGAFLLCIFPGLYECACPNARMFFRYNRSTNKYEQSEEPQIYAKMALM